jgi:hypothetical protein
MKNRKKPVIIKLLQGTEIFLDNIEKTKRFRPLKKKYNLNAPFNINVLYLFIALKLQGLERLTFYQLKEIPHCRRFQWELNKLIKMNIIETDRTRYYKLTQIGLSLMNDIIKDHQNNRIKQTEIMNKIFSHKCTLKG